MDFWVWLVIILIAWALEAAAGARKRARQQRQQQQQRRPAQRVPPPPAPPAPPAPPRPEPRAQRPEIEPSRAPRFPRAPERPRPPAAPGSPGPVRPPTPPKREPLVFEVPVERPPRSRDVEARGWLEGVSAEAESLESLEPYHRRALGKYGPAEEAARPVRRRRFVLRPATVREAIVWSEILGRPKSER